MRYLLLVFLSACILTSGCGGLGKSEADYKKETIPIKYEDVVRNPDSFNKKSVFLSNVNVREVKETNKNVEMFLMEEFNFLSSNPNRAFYVSYTVKENEERLMKGDTIRVWGDFQKISNRPHPGAPGFEQINTVDINAKYISRPVWNSLLKSFNTNLKSTFNNKEFRISMSIEKINENSISIQGEISEVIFPGAGDSFNFTGLIDDNGIGKAKYLDNSKNDTNIEANIKITKDTIEINTPEVKLEKQIFNKTKISILESGNYIFKTKT